MKLLAANMVWRRIFLTGVNFFFLIILLSCGTSAETPKKEKETVQPVELVNTDKPVAPVVVSFDRVKNVVWILSEVRVGYGSILLDRNLMSANDMADYFTLQFNTEGINGKAAPNRYFAPYAVLDGKNVRIRPIAGTLIESLVNIGGFTERRYYDILQTVTRWDYKDDILHLYAPGEKEGDEMYMIFKNQL